ncbi:MAG: ATP-binding protein [Pseudomonadota bacterium]
MQPRTGELARLLHAKGELQTLEASPRPAFLWNDDGSTLLWANPAAARLTGFATLDELIEANFSGSALTAQLGMAVRGLRPGIPRMELLRMPAKGRSLSFIARISLIQVEDNTRLLVIGPETKPAMEITPSAVPMPQEKPFSKEPGLRTAPRIEKPLKVKKPKKKKEDKNLVIEEKLAAPEKTKKEKKNKIKKSDAEKTTIRIARQKAKIDGALTPVEHESLVTIARVLTGKEEIPLQDNTAGETTPTLSEIVETTPPVETPASEEQLIVAQDNSEREALRNALKDIEDLQMENGALQNELHGARVMTAELQTILDTATDGIFILDGEGHILNMNRPAEALFGLNLDALEGENIIDLLDADSQERALVYIQRFTHNTSARVLNGGCEVDGIEKNGGRIPLFMTLGSLGGDIPGSTFCAVLRDITQWKQAEEELLAAKKRAEAGSEQKTDFLAKISHEIRTPLNAIIGFSEIMLEERFGPVDNERYKNYLNDIRNSGGHLLSLVNDLLDLSKIDSGKLDLVFAPVQLNDIVLQTISLLQPQANRSGVILRSSLQPVPPLAADARSLKQVLLNILANAVRFTPEGGQVIISTLYEADGSASLRVRDTGIGMAQDDIALALEPFRQIRTGGGEGEKQEGTGLGLPISKALVEANHAVFEIQSEPKKGTLVSVIFPKARILDEAF